MDIPTIPQPETNELVLNELQAIETGWGPKAEAALLMEHLSDDAGHAESFPNPLARINAYKHRLHSLRCDYANARVRSIELEEQLAEARLQVLRLQERVLHLENAEQNLHQIYSSRWWKMKERCSRWYHRVFFFRFQLSLRRRPKNQT